MIWSMIALLGIDISQGHTAVGRGDDEDDTHTGGDLMTRALRWNPTSGMACSVLVDVLCGSALQVLPAWQKLGCGHCPWGRRRIFPQIQYSTKPRELNVINAC